MSTFPQKTMAMSAFSQWLNTPGFLRPIPEMPLMGYFASRTPCQPCRNFSRTTFSLPPFSPHKVGDYITRDIYPHLLLADRLHWTLEPYQGGASLPLILFEVMMFCSSSVINPCQSIVACETDPCPMFDFLDHLHWDNGEPFIAKASQQCAASQGFDGPPVLSTTHRHPVWLSIETAFSKIDRKKILTLLPPLYLVDTP